MESLEQLDARGGDESWQQLCGRISADCFARFWRGNKVQVPYKNWRITLDTNTVPTGESSVTVTRMRVPFVNRDGFRFKLYRKDFFSALGQLCGMHTIKSGYPEFDRDFIEQGTDEEKVRNLLSVPNIRQLVQAQPAINLEVRDNEGWLGVSFPAEVDELCFRAAGFINDVEQLKLLFALCAEILDHLCRTGSACEDEPELTL